MDRPFGLLAELTYACPLHCPYCSNPLNLGDYSDELTTQEWQRVLAEAKELGVLQLHLSGGEPLQRRDLVEIVSCATGLGLYTNLITSGLSLSSHRAEQLRAAGLDHVQISIQADEPALADRIAGTPSFDRKKVAARLVKKLGWPLTVNVVLHRHNIDRVDRMLDMAADLGADRIELANTQYYGWAWRNRDGLLPSRAQLERAEAMVRAALEISVVFGFFDGVAPLVGILVGHDVGQKIGGEIADHVGVAALCLYGLYLIVRALRTATQEELEAEHRWSIFGLPVPLSLDNVIAGTGLGLLGLSPLVPAILFGTITALMTLAGLQLGRVVSRIIRIRLRWDVVVGVALIIEALMLGLRVMPGD